METLRTTQAQAAAIACRATPPATYRHHPGPKTLLGVKVLTSVKMQALIPAVPAVTSAVLGQVMLLDALRTALCHGAVKTQA